MSKNGKIHSPDRVVVHSNFDASLIDYKTGIEYHLKDLKDNTIVLVESSNFNSVKSTFFFKVLLTRIFSSNFIFIRFARISFLNVISLVISRTILSNSALEPYLTFSIAAENNSLL